jgi:hypothetical protein
MDMSSLFADVIVPIVAILGLFLSIYNVYRHWREYRPNISLEFSYQDTAFEPAVGEIPFQCYVLLVKNLGNVNIILDAAGVKWGDKKYIRKYYGSTITDVYHDFPFKLTPGSTLEIEFGVGEIQGAASSWGLSGAVKIIGFVRDGEKKIYTSPALAVNVK